MGDERSSSLNLDNYDLLWENGPMEKEVNPENKNSRPSCFGDEGKFVAYMEDPSKDSECLRCPSEGDCGEFILLKCSRELMF